MSPPAPALSPLGRLLPASLQATVRDWARGLDLPGVVADLFLSYPTQELGYDPAATKRWLLFLERTVCRYFRLTVLGAENIPAGRALVVGCHSGVLPWDATCLVVAIRKHTGRFSRNIGERFFGKIAAVERFLGSLGIVIGEQERLRALLERDEVVILFPGGAQDMRRPFWERYHVRPHVGFAPGRGGYIKSALRTRSPIVPVAILGAEEVHVLLGDIPAVARTLGLPYWPVVLSPLPLPARIYIRFGTPIHLDAPPEAADDQATVDRLNRRVRGALQALIHDTCRHRRGVYLSSYEAGDGAGGSNGRRPGRRAR